MLAFDTPIKFVKGVGPRIAETLAEKGVTTVEDLLYHLPFRYEDRLHPSPLDQLQAGEMASVIGEVRGSTLLRTRSMPIFELTVGQGLSSIKCMWFHGAYLKDKFKSGQMIALYGKVEPSRSRPGFKMIQPQFELLPDDHDDDPNAEQSRLLEVGRITPVYESLGGSKLASRWTRRVIYDLLEELKSSIPETLPAELLDRLKLPAREDAIRSVHFPVAGTPITQLQEFSTPAHRRLIFEELFYLELGLELKRRRFKERVGIAFETNTAVREAIRQVLPFHPTAAQKRALGEIVADMRRPGPMRRLLQGDVGSGKTIVALQAMLIAIENGYQAALMAPTEILATQHYLGARKLLERSPKRYQVTLLTGSLDEDRKRSARGRIFRGEANLVIGTHALIEEKVDFANLGLVVVDEQHRFGVMQRFRMIRKPNADGTERGEPDVLVMTATPIPRTLALSLYGDLDLSVLDELPPGRTPIVTRRLPDQRSAEVWAFVRKQVAGGHQAYVVYPVIEGNRDDQPELDFAPAEPEQKSDQGSTAPSRRSAPNSAQGAGQNPATDSSGISVKTSSSKTTAKKNPKPPSLFPTEKPTLKSAVSMFESLRSGELAEFKVGLLHGRLDADEKEVVMARFQRGEIQVLIATTVIEVGVDVPNATVMVIEHAERFGMAQLHQLRGRVGRGAARSYCILLTGGAVSPQGEERLAAMVRTQDGFELAELDLQLRGPGEFFGTKQAGMPEFRVANLLRDRKLLELAKEEATSFVQNSGAGASDDEKAQVWARLRLAWQRRYGLVEAG
ncbi:MAG TPA: ATP-dependent DNA helicase RecG [Acidisarcina sp.]